jgi:hypothetical protein
MIGRLKAQQSVYHAASVVLCSSLLSFCLASSVCLRPVERTGCSPWFPWCDPSSVPHACVLVIIGVVCTYGRAREVHTFFMLDVGDKTEIGQTRTDGQHGQVQDASDAEAGEVVR